ncbi:TPA: 16S rRNA (cytosine(1402)-N(4))-methyltransferase [Candidatus Taylorbacteria bacterium]|nr:16S rRNA (cytosine(1402)-N(4))-methyltransferase [Candidatus Taylorbacteria bacterium]
MTHTTVLLHEAVDGLNLKQSSIFVDATLNAGGHSELVLSQLDGNVRVIGIDIDADAIARAKARIIPANTTANIAFFQENFRNIDKVLDQAGVAQVDGILFDLGLSSNQIEESGRGFSFKTDEPLLMTMKKDLLPGEFTAFDIVNTWGEDSLADIIYGYGEDRFARRIAKAIVTAREIQPIKTAQELSDIVASAVPKFGFKKINPATKTFQAIRIAVNDELGAIKETLPKAFARLNPGGRMALISFHSLEDRIVKRFFKEKAEAGEGRLITKKPQIPSPQEVAENPRSRSAKLRIIEKL